MQFMVADIENYKSVKY